MPSITTKSFCAKLYRSYQMLLVSDIYTTPEKGTHTGLRGGVEGMLDLSLTPLPDLYGRTLILIREGVRVAQYTLNQSRIAGPYNRRRCLHRVAAAVRDYEEKQCYVRCVIQLPYESIGRKPYVATCSPESFASLIAYIPTDVEPAQIRICDHSGR